MSKTLIIDTAEKTKTPFLRGILTRSLQDTGLPFEDAYKLATLVRHELTQIEELTTDQLRSMVLKYLRQSHGSAIAQRYLTPAHSAFTIMVESTNDQIAPFSRGELRRCLESCGTPTEKAMGLVAKIHDHLINKRRYRISSRRLGLLTYRILRRELGEEAARRYLVRVEYRHGNRPLLLLIGGTAGCGKSTIATELASRLDIVRTQSTDMLREVMRTMLPSRLLPVLHTSSFNAWEALPHTANQPQEKETLLADGYRTQADLLSVACEAVIQRALKERVSLILEGVHIHPSLLANIPNDSDAVVVPIMLAVLKPEQLRLRIRGRGKQVPDRRAERYLENFDAIWQLQSYLLSEADRARIPIIPNDDKRKVLEQVTNTIIDALAKNVSATPEEVFI